MDRFEEFVSRSVKFAVFGPGVMWRKFGNNELIRSRVGDEFPVMFLPLHIAPPAMVGGTKVTFKAAHFGAHAFIDVLVVGSGGSLKFVAAFCMVDGDHRAAAEHLLETTRDANGELGGLDASFRFAAAKIPGTGNFVSTGVLQFNAEHLVNAYNLWRMTKAEHRETLKDARCPQCRAMT